MKTLFPKPLTVTLMLMAFAVSILFGASPVEAKWHDHSDEYPGGANVTPYLVAAGVVTAGLIAYLVLKSDSDDSADGPEDLFPTGEESEPDGAESTSSVSEDDSESPTGKATVSPLGADQESRLGLFFDVKDDRVQYGSQNPAQDFSDMTVTAGITIGF